MKKKLFNGEEIEVTDIGEKQFLICNSIIVSGNVYFWTIYFLGLLTGILIGL